MLFHSNFLRAIATLSAGQILAAVIPFLAAPVLGRIYQPEDYGLFASYSAIVNVFASIATLHYHHGVLTERAEPRGHQMAYLSLVATAGVAALMIPVAIGIFLLDPFETANIGHRGWFLLLPVSTLVIGMSLTAMAVANRARTYRKIAVTQFSAAAASALSSIAFGHAGFRSDGLMMALLLSQTITFGF